MIKRIITYIKETTSTLFSLAVVTFIAMYLFVPKKHLMNAIFLLADNGFFTLDDFRCYMDLLTCLIFTVGYYQYHKMKSSFSYRKKSCRENYIDIDDINGDPDALVSKLLKMSNGRLIELYKSSADNSEYEYIKDFDIVKIASKYGDVVDHLLCRIKCDFNIMYIDMYLTDKSSAAVFLSEQGFIFVDESENIIHFRKDDIHIKIAYALNTPECIEVYRNNINSDIEKCFSERFDSTEENIYDQ